MAHYKMVAEGNRYDIFFSIKKFVRLEKTALSFAHIKTRHNLAKPQSLSLIAEMSEKIVFIRQAAGAQQYFADCFKKLFELDHCAIYRVSEKKDLFIRCFPETPKKKNTINIKYPLNASLKKEIPEDREKYLFLNKEEFSIISDINEPNHLIEILLCIRRSGDVELFFYGFTKTNIQIAEADNNTCRIFSNFYLQVQDSLQIRNNISAKQNELSGRITENNDSLIQLNEKLLQSNQELQQFAYSASHDLQEPLRNISAYINLFLRSYGNTLTEEGNEYLHFASDAAQRMHHLIKDLLTFSKLDHLEEPMSKFDGNDIIRKALDNLHLAVEESNALILYPDLPVLYGNHSQILLLFQNLIDNAIKFRSKSEPMVFIDMEEKSDQWEFKIKDNGIGIPQQFQTKIFGFFNRLHPRDKIQGSGLGLSICKKIVEKHHGIIVVESKPGKGSTFTFTLNKD